MAGKIAILFANLKGNIGDFAILHAVLADLHAKFPGRSLHVYSHQFHPIDQRRLSAFRDSHPLDFELAGRTVAPVLPPKLIVEAAKALGVWPAIQARLIARQARSAGPEAKTFKDYENIVLVGGAHWSGAKVGVSMFATLAAVHRHNPNIHAYPFSVEAKVTRFNSADALRSLFGMIRVPLIVRDGISQDVLQRLEIGCVLGADSVFSLGRIAEGLEPAAGRNHSRILLALAEPRPDELRSALQRLRAAGREVALLTTCEIEDGPRMRPVATEMGIPYLAPDTWQEAVAEIKSSALLVSNRLHGLILGCLADMPLLPLANRQKTRAFVEDAEMPHSAADLGALSGALIDRCQADRDDVLRAVRQYRNRTTEMIQSPFRQGG